MSGCDFVEVPWDTLMRYKHRIEDTVGRHLEGRRLALAVKLDGAEQAEWCARFTASGPSLGRVIEEVMKEREALWVSFGGASEGQKRPRRARTATSRPGRCQDYNNGTCPKTLDCQQGQHRCSMLLQTGRVCASRRHTAASCDAKGKA